MKIGIKIVVATLLLTVTLYSSKKSHKIASIPEASGISYCKNSNTLIVANDEGSFYEIEPSGKIISKKRLGDYDLEGVVCEDREMIFAVEGGSLLRVNRKSLKVKEIKIKGDFKFNKKSGIEGITKVGRHYYLSIQSKKSKSKAKLLIVRVGNRYAKIIKVVNHKIIDSAGMELYRGKIYIVSDKKDKLYIYNYKTNSIKKRIKLDKFAQEGITFDRDNIYFADDNGGVFKYSKEELGID